MTVAIDRDELVTENKKLVHFVANKFRHLINSSFDYDDLVQVGYIGLMKAADRFEKNGKAKFNTFAYSVIEGEIRNYLRDKSRVVRIPANLQQLIIKITHYENETTSDVELANRYNCSINSVKRAKAIIDQGEVTSLDRQAFDGNETITLADSIGQDADFTTVFVNEFLSSLNEREYKFVMGKLNDKSDREMASELGVARMTVHVLKKRIKEKLDCYMSS